MILAIPFPVIDPVLIEIGPLAIRWYALAYVAGILGCWYVVKRLAATWPGAPDERTIDDFVVWITFGIILGGRLGYVLFYKPGYYLANPAEIVFVWQGGMSYHGGMLGVIGAVLLFARQRKIRLLALGDAVACAVPIGLFFGRLANFINGELWGKPAELPWTFIVNGTARHPSQLYEALLEGVALFVILWFYSSKPRPYLAVSAMFLLFYGIFRFAVEFVRLPDKDPGYLAYGWVTMGQVLSAPMILAGMIMLYMAYRSASAAEVKA